MSMVETAPARTRWSRVAVGAVAGIAAVSIVVGFAWLPGTQPNARLHGIWDAICSAAGLVYRSPANEPVVQPAYPISHVEITPQMLRGASAASIGSGATLALRCSMCHGTRRLSGAETPDLAGQPAAAIYKELVDFQSGVRASAVMRPLVADLSDADMRDLAAYYAYLPRQPGARRDAGPVPRIVADGAPMRGIAPCGACHGVLNAKAGAPWLGGEPAAYLRSQLVAFASGARTNDISEQMRNVARALTPAEIDAASRYYAAHP